MESSSNYNKLIAKVYDALYAQWISPSQTDAECRQIAQLTPSGGQIADFGCGTGRHLISLSHLGFNVTGVEPSREMIKQLRQKKPKANVINSSVLDFSIKDKSFDTIICMWNALCEIALDQSNLNHFFALCHHLSSPTSHLVLDISVLQQNEIPKKQFSYSTNYNGLKYILEWKLLNFDNQISSSLQKISTIDQTDRLIEVREATLQQKWWTQKELVKTAKANGWNLTPLSTPSLAPGRYFVGTKNQKPRT